MTYSSRIYCPVCDRTSEPAVGDVDVLADPPCVDQVACTEVLDALFDAEVSVSAGRAMEAERDGVAALPLGADGSTATPLSPPTQESDTKVPTQGPAEAT